MGGKIRMITKKIDQGLHILATPIGTANDITLRALQVLRDADVLAAEDTRVLRKLMDIHGFRVHAAPGASAVLTALCLAGQPTDTFFFGGFLGSKTSQRLRNLEKVAQLGSTLVYYESPKRTVATLKDMAKVLGDDRPVSVCRELTKKFEEVIRGTINEAIEMIANRDSFKGEVVIVLGPPIKKEISDEDIHQALNIALQEYRIKDAASQIAEQFGIPRKRAYEMALKIKNGDQCL